MKLLYSKSSSHVKILVTICQFCERSMIKKIACQILTWYKKILFYIPPYWFDQSSTAVYNLNTHLPDRLEVHPTLDTEAPIHIGPVPPPGCDVSSKLLCIPCLRVFLENPLGTSGTQTYNLWVKSPMLYLLGQIYTGVLWVIPFSGEWLK